MSEYQAAAAAGKDMFESSLKSTSNMSPDNATLPVLEHTNPHGAVWALKHALDKDLHQHHADLQVGTDRAAIAFMLGSNVTFFSAHLPPC